MSATSRGGFHADFQAARRKRYSQSTSRGSMMMMGRGRVRREGRIVERRVREIDAGHGSVRTRVRAMNVRPEEGQQRMELAAHKRVAVRTIPASVWDRVHEGDAIGKRGSRDVGDTGERNIEQRIIG